MRILGVERSGYATNHYRVFQPLYKMLENKLADVSTFKVEDYVLHQEKVVNLVLGADVILTYAPSNEDWLNFIKMCRKNGKTVVADFDDDPFNVSPWNPSYRTSGIQEVAYTWPDGTVDMLWSEDMIDSTGKTNFFNIEDNIRARDLFAVNFKKADLVTTTTDILAESLRKVNPNVAVLPNLVDFSAYPVCELVKKEIRIGWQGGSSHYEDLWIIVEPMRQILEKYPNVKFIYWGDMRMAGVFKKFPQDRVEFHPWVSYVAYPYKLATVNLDIGLCPLSDNVFNRNKSAIKYFEYSVVGASTIATDIPPYSMAITSGRDGILVNNEDWFMAIENLVLDKSRRIALAKGAYENIYENHNADKKAYLWAEAYSKLLKQPIEV